MKHDPDVSAERQKFLVSLVDRPPQRYFRVRADRCPERRWASGPFCSVPLGHKARDAFDWQTVEDDNRVASFLHEVLGLRCGFDSVDEPGPSAFDVATWPVAQRTVARIAEHIR